MDVLFISSSRKGKGISPFVLSQGESLKLLGINVNYYLIEGGGFFKYLKSIFIIKRNIKIKGYDLIHAHYGLSGVISRLTGYNKKVITSFLGDDLMGNVKSNGRYSKRSKVLVFINKFFAKYCFDENIVKSQSLADRFFKNTNYLIIPNGVDLNLFAPIDKVVARKSLGLNIEGKYFLFLGDTKRTVKNYKLFETSLESIKELKNYKVLILTGIDKDRTNLYYNAADICILSSFHEGSPNVIKEAMVCNSVIVSTDVGDVQWLFGDVEGYFIADSEPIKFAEAIDRAISFCNTYNTPKGRERIINLGLDNKNVANKILEIYKSVCKI